mmetsp:Transcript_31479/g.80241  ORF Transcript_31479/g.80241 Transcript_31479/m.80241 type:complete len:252 (+) Transcript_31479:140-895(+)
MGNQRIRGYLGGGLGHACVGVAAAGSGPSARPHELCAPLKGLSAHFRQRQAVESHEHRHAGVREERPRAGLRDRGEGEGGGPARGEHDCCRSRLTGRAELHTAHCGDLRRNHPVAGRPGHAIDQDEAAHSHHHQVHCTQGIADSEKREHGCARGAAPAEEWLAPHLVNDANADGHTRQLRKANAQGQGVLHRQAPHADVAQKVLRVDQHRRRGAGLSQDCRGHGQQHPVAGAFRHARRLDDDGTDVLERVP